METAVENGLHLAVPIYVLGLLCLLVPGRVDPRRVYTAYKGGQMEHGF